MGSDIEEAAQRLLEQLEAARSKVSPPPAADTESGTGATNLRVETVPMGKIQPASLVAKAWSRSMLRFSDDFCARLKLAIASTEIDRPEDMQM